jgi:hypothetical protein
MTSMLRKGPLRAHGLSRLCVLTLVGAAALWANSLLAHGPAGDRSKGMLFALNNDSRSVAAVGFEENKGQVTTTDGVPATDVRFRYAQGATSIFLLRNGIAYQFNRRHRPEGMEALEQEARHAPTEHVDLHAMREQVRLETYRMDMLLEGADPDAAVSTEGRSADHTNYYTHDVLDVHTYTRITYHEVYPGIDWVVYTTDAGLKYDFVVRPGADPEQIKLRFMHHEELRVEADGSLTHGNHLGRFTEAPPVSFQGARVVGTRFVLDADPEQPGQALLRFALDPYDRAATLRIDPARLWGTFYGGADNDGASSCTVDGSGNVYLAGTTYSINSIASGGHQNTYGGNAGGLYGDAFLVKFNGEGVRQWSTYYGGSAADAGNSCCVDNSGNVFLAGGTFSSNGIAAGGHQNTYGGDAGGQYYGDAFLVKFNGAGVRQWSTYYGGGSGDAGYSCCVDNSGNVFLAGNTLSNTAIASMGHQNTYGGGVGLINGDAFLAKFNGAGVRQWGTYYGGNQIEQGHSCVADGNGDVYLAGHTVSANAIANGGHQNTYGGGMGSFYGDAFLVKFSGAGVRQWGTYYGGSDIEQGYSCAVDGSGNVFLAGYTLSTDAIASGGHQNIPGGVDPDAFLVKFNGAGVRQWGTYYGGSDEDRGYSCCVDGSGNVFLAGYTLSNAAIASAGHQNVIGGGGAPDAFLVKFNSLGIREWGTYYGGVAYDGGFSCTVDGSGNVFLAGFAVSTNAIASPGAHQFANGGGSRDAFLAKFSVWGGGIGIGEAASRGSEVFPNPADGLVTVQLDQPPAPGDRYKVLDAAGKLVLQGRLAEQVSIIDLRQEISGVYLLQLITARGILSERIIKR